MVHVLKKENLSVMTKILAPLQWRLEDLVRIGVKGFNEMAVGTS